MKYKLVVFVPLLVLMGCSHKHTCIVKNVRGNKIYACDIDSGTDKTFTMKSGYQHFEYVYPGDTVECMANNDIQYTQNDIIELPHNGYLITNTDSLNARQIRKWRENLRRAGYRYWNQVVR